MSKKFLTETFGVLPNYMIEEINNAIADAKVLQQRVYLPVKADGSTGQGDKDTYANYLDLTDIVYDNLVMYINKENSNDPAINPEAKKRLCATKIAIVDERWYSANSAVYIECDGNIPNRIYRQGGAESGGINKAYQTFIERNPAQPASAQATTAQPAQATTFAVNDVVKDKATGKNLYVVLKTGANNNFLIMDKDRKRYTATGEDLIKEAIVLDTEANRSFETGQVEKALQILQTAAAQNNSAQAGYSGASGLTKRGNIFCSDPTLITLLQQYLKYVKGANIVVDGVYGRITMGVAAQHITDLKEKTIAQAAEGNFLCNLISKNRDVWTNEIKSKQPNIQIGAVETKLNLQAVTIGNANAPITYQQLQSWEKQNQIGNPNAANQKDATIYYKEPTGFKNANKTLMAKYKGGKWVGTYDAANPKTLVYTAPTAKAPAKRDSTLYFEVKKQKKAQKLFERLIKSVTK